MRFHRPARRIALGLGAAGIALGSGGLAVAATTLIQPAGALSVQVPAVAVREQNVNAAGRIRVALPKSGVGVNGTVSVNNLPVSSAAVAHANRIGRWDSVTSGTTLTLTDVTGSGTFDGVVARSGAAGPGIANCRLEVVIDGSVMLDSRCDGGGFRGGSGLSGYTNHNRGVYSLEFFPPQGLPFHKSLVVTISATSGVQTLLAGNDWYTTSS
jgi:hypothetical protein